MRVNPPADASPSESQRRGDWRTLRHLVPYLMQFKSRLILALALLIIAKLANVAVPLILKDIVDALDHKTALTILPLGLILLYGAFRLAATAIGELRDAIFAKVSQGAIRRIASQVFDHLHRLSLRFHLDRQTGGVTRDIERGTRGIASLLRLTVFNILPTIIEIGLVTAILIAKYEWRFAAVTLGTIAVYIGYTFSVTEWRTKMRRSMNELDSKANVRAVDSIINYETVKYFGNELFESKRYDDGLAKWEVASVRNEVSLAILNTGQAAIISVGVTLLVWLAADGVVAGRMSLGDLVLVNAFLIQLYAPLNFLGMVYREIKQSLTDMEKMFNLLHENEEIKDEPNATTLKTQAVTVRFRSVDFHYNANRSILCEVDFTIPAGQIVAVVGSSGAGKSTLSRLLFRFYDVVQGAIEINGVDIRRFSQTSLRSHIGIVPQDTVLFNETIYYNIAYGRPEASRDEVIEAAKAAHIYEFIKRLPDGFATTVGERGLKLSGGEKQRVAIARMILKNPPILIFDEATSALDSKTEKAIQAELAQIAQHRTTLVIAHRLSTIVDADQILVMEQGRVAERGNHRELIALNGIYARMWALQQSEVDSDSLE